MCAIAKHLQLRGSMEKLIVLREKKFLGRVLEQ